MPEAKFQVTCLSCKARIKVPENLRGQSGRCPECGTVNILDAAIEATAPPPPPPPVPALSAYPAHLVGPADNQSTLVKNLVVVIVGLVGLFIIGGLLSSRTTEPQRSRDEPYADYPEDPTSEEFRRFMIMFATTNMAAELQTDVELFSDVEDMGSGILHVTATDFWLSGPPKLKASNLNTIYEMWDVANYRERQVWVCILDSKGNVVMEHPRPN